MESWSDGRRLDYSEFIVKEYEMGLKMAKKKHPE